MNKIIIKLLKQNVDFKKWTEFVEEIIWDITTKKRWPDTGLIASIFVN